MTWKLLFIVYVFLLTTSVVQSEGGRGIVMCAGNRHLRYLQRNLYLVKTILKSNLSFAIIHCRELAGDFESNLHLVDSNVKVIDICDREHVFGLPFHKIQKRLRGFYCKIAALLKSPFTETILMDIDTIWFKQPEVIFEAPGYKDTGTLFMRSRMALYNGDLEHSTNALAPVALLKHFLVEGVAIEQAAAQNYYRSNGINLYWQTLARGGNIKSGSNLNGIQDSSVVAVDKSRHHGMLAVLHRYLQTNFLMGYGDKELFWIAATVANESFALEPYFSGQFGDCASVQLHFDPTILSPAQTTPLYVNGEYIVERGSEPDLSFVKLKEVTAVGEFLQLVISKPVLVIENTTFVDIGGRNWIHEPPHRGCVCILPPSDNAVGLVGKENGVIDCIVAPDGVLQHMILAQWITYTSTLPRLPATNNNNNNNNNKNNADNNNNKHALAVFDPPCVEVLVSMASTLQRAFSSFVHPDHCVFIGCPSLPIEVNMTLWTSKHIFHGNRLIRFEDHEYCDPVAFFDPTKTIAATNENDNMTNDRSDQQLLVLPSGNNNVCAAC